MKFKIDEKGHIRLFPLERRLSQDSRAMRQASACLATIIPGALSSAHPKVLSCRRLWRFKEVS